MDLIDKLKELASRIQRQKDSVLTEQATKTAFVLPFLQCLGYDVFNPLEVIPELTADHGVKKGEKVDYAIKRDGKIIILIECKSVGADLESKHAGQLFRYFSVTEARFGVLTDGIRYVFFSDLENENKMDERPFFEINLLQFGDAQVEELKKFTNAFFDLDTITSTASNLKYHKALLAEIKSEFENPSEDLVKLLAGKVYSGRVTQSIKEQFKELTLRALKDYVRERLNDRLKSALEAERSSSEEAESVVDIHASNQTESSDIETTEEEWEGYHIIRAIGSEVVDPERIYIRDAKSSCAVILDDNRRRAICRFFFTKNKMSIQILAPGNEEKIELDKLVSIYKYRDMVKEAILQYVQEQNVSL